MLFSLRRCGGVKRKGIDTCGQVEYCGGGLEFIDSSEVLQGAVGHV